MFNRLNFLSIFALSNTNIYPSIYKFSYGKQSLEAVPILREGFFYCILLMEIFKAFWNTTDFNYHF